jgi:hypothetical protein
MTCTAQELNHAMDEFSGGSEERFRHPFSRKFLYTAGVQQVAELAGAYWLIDTLALKIAPIFAKAWSENRVGIGIVKLHVFTDAEHAADSSLPAARLSLSLTDNGPNAYVEDITFTDFPQGEWLLFLGTDEIGPNRYVTTVYLPQEH